MKPPSFNDFLALPPDFIAQIAPETIIFAVGGTRRSAVLAGIALDSDDYVRWSCKQMIACISQIFRLGVCHVFTTAIRPGQLSEVGHYQAHLLQWVEQGLSGPEALATYTQLGWRVRLLGTENLPALQAAAERLEASTPPQWKHTLWWYVVPTVEAPWEWIFAAVHRAQAHTRVEAVKALYGEDIPQAKLYLAFGKPMIAPDICPPLLLSGDLAMYWTQCPGFGIDEVMLRQIFYDYAYLRKTWRADRTGRYDDLLNQRALWETKAVLGIGHKVGDFWYPIPFPSISKEEEPL